MADNPKNEDDPENKDTNNLRNVEDANNENDMKKKDDDESFIGMRMQIDDFIYSVTYYATGTHHTK